VTEKSNNKDVCYYAAFNFPAFVYVQGADDWPKYRKLFQKLTSVNDVSTKRTLSHSIHQLATILGPELTMSDLIVVFNKFIEDPNPQVREGAFKTMHILLNEVEEKERPKYINIIKRAYDNAPKA
jgi:serine/threonine-protein phosphatase 4 regulatory subunit 1